MSRDLTPAFEAETLAGQLRPVIFVEVETATITVRFWTGIGEIAWNGQTWVGAGRLLGISPVEETGETRATGITLSLNSIPNDLVSLVLQDARQGKPVNVWLGAMTDDGQVIADPAQVFSGKLDVPEIIDGADTCTISVTAESRLIELERAPDRKYTPEDLALDYPGDRGLDFVTQIQDTQVVWGRA